MSRLNGFLTGLRVLDLSRHLPGPLATLYLADMGADVLKIESVSGDETRQVGPKLANGSPAYFTALSAGKSLKTLDFRDPGQLEELLKLVASADVLVESFRPGVMAKLGAGYERLRAVNPRLVYCALSGYGQSGPLQERAGHDANYLAGTGILERNGYGRPSAQDAPVADCAASLTAVVSILAALRDRDRTGKGCLIDIALADAAMPFQILQIAELSATGVAPSSNSGLFNGGAAFYRTYRTADGRWIALGAVEPKFWIAFCRAAGKPDWIARQAEPLPQEDLIAELEQYFAALTLKEGSDRFELADCCYSEVVGLEDALASPHNLHRNLVRRGDDGLLQALMPVHIDGEPPATRITPAPGQRSWRSC